MNNVKGDTVTVIDGNLETSYYRGADHVFKKLNEVSPSFCLAKWYNVSIHIPTGQTHSCYHPRSHKIPMEEIVIDVSALHNTKYKKEQRKLMLEGQRPSECSFCWETEDSGDQLSDRAYRSKDVFQEGLIEEAVLLGHTGNPNPRYVEVNFNQACNFKCSYCSPHLSTAWMSDIEHNGPFILADRKHNDLTWMKKIGTPDNSSDNPYVQAFWEWLPKIYPTLQTFRMTGGEPLMDKNTFKMFDYIHEHPKTDLNLSITSNCCPPGNQWDKFLISLKKINENNAIEHFMLFCSLDSWGKQAEYIRNGMDFDVLYKNLDQYLRKSTNHSLTFIVTFNVLSYPRWIEYIKNILRMRRIYNTDRQLIWFDIPQLSSPEWLSAKMIPEMVTVLEESVKLMTRFKETENSRFRGFKDFEISKVQRLIDWIKSPSQFDKETHMKNFYLFIQEQDKRRETNFLETFPELTTFWEQCKDANGS
jgi:sulfatase maturation enzyme AslB (radical SAM superfamily)